MTQATKVAEIFSVAGEAFTKLSKLAMSLQSNSSQDNGKWDDDEIEMLKKAISQFGNDIEKISEKIKTKSTIQIKNTLKSKVAQNLSNYPTNNTNTQKATAMTPIQNTNVNTHHVSVPEQPIKPPITKTPEQHVTNVLQQHAKHHVLKPPEQFATKIPDQHIMKTPEAQLTKLPEQQVAMPPGLQHIAVRAQTVEQNTLVAMKPRLITIQGQNISERSPVMAIPQSQVMSVGTKHLAMKPTGVTTPASIITSQLNKSPSKVQIVQKTVNLKPKVDTLPVAGMMSLADGQSPTKKMKVDSPNLNMLTSALLSQRPMNGQVNQINRMHTSGTAGVVPGQGFQVLMPSSAKTLYPVSVRPTGIVQRVADANSTTGNIDVEG